MNDQSQAKPDIYEIECSQREQIATLQSQLTQAQAEVAKVNGFREELRAKFHHKSDLYSEAVSHLESCRQQLSQAREDARLLRVQIDVSDAAFQQCHKERDELSAQAAVIREALDRLLVNAIEFYHDWKKGDFDLPELAMCDMRSMALRFDAAKSALSTTAGTALLARLNEAEWLLSQPLLAKMSGQPLLLEWHRRREAFRNGVK